MSYGDQSPSGRLGNRVLAALMVVVGIFLLLPGACVLIVIFQPDMLDMTMIPWILIGLAGIGAGIMLFVWAGRLWRR